MGPREIHSKVSPFSNPRDKFSFASCVAPAPKRFLPSFHGSGNVLPGEGYGGAAAALLMTERCHQGSHKGPQCGR